MRKRDRPHLDVFQVLVGEEPSELVLVGKGEERRAVRNFVRWTGSSRSHRVEENTEETGVLWGVPHRQREPAARLEDADELCRCLLGPAKVEQGKIANDRIERLVREGQRL